MSSRTDTLLESLGTRKNSAHMDKLKVMGFAAALLLLVIAVEYALIYFANVKADILQSLKVFVPATVGVALILVLMPSPKSKEAAEDADKEEEKVDVDKT